MSISHYIKDIGRGKDGARAIDRAAAADLMGQVLDGQVSDIALSPADRHRIDSVAREFTLSASAATRAAGGDGLPPDARPEDAFRAWFDARRAEATGRVPAAALDAIAERLRLRRALAVPGPQAMVAEQVALVELDAAMLSERHPRLVERAATIVREAASSRAAAADALDQVVANARAQLALARLALDPGGTQP